MRIRERKNNQDRDAYIIVFFFIAVASCDRARKRREEIERIQTRARITLVSVRAAHTGRTEKNPTRNLFPTCQDDSACTVGARPDHYKRVENRAKREDCSIEVENANGTRSGRWRGRLRQEREFSRRGLWFFFFLFSHCSAPSFVIPLLERASAVAARHVCVLDIRRFHPRICRGESRGINVCTIAPNTGRGRETATRPCLFPLRATSSVYILANAR